MKPQKSSSMADLSKKAGVHNEHKALYRLYSKYVHASAWLLFSTKERARANDVRTIFTIKTQFYAGDTFARISDAVALPT